MSQRDVFIDPAAVDRLAEDVLIAVANGRDSLGLLCFGLEGSVTDAFARARHGVLAAVQAAAGDGVKIREQSR